MRRASVPTRPISPVEFRFRPSGLVTQNDWQLALGRFIWGASYFPCLAFVPRGPRYGPA